MALRWLLLDLSPVLVPLLLLALQKSEAVWFRPFMNDIARVLGAIPVIGTRLADRVVSIEANLRHYLGAQVIAAEQPIVRWINGIRTFITQVFYTATNTAISAGRSVEQLAHVLEHDVAVPAKVTWKKVTRTVYRLDKKTVAAIAAAVAGLHTLKHTATVAIPRGIEGEIADLRGYVNRRAERLGKQIKALARPALLGLTLGALYSLLRRLGLGWLKCGNVSKAGKNVCGMDAGLLESLLADTLLIAGTVSLVEFAEGMQTLTADVIEPIRTFWRAT